MTYTIDTNVLCLPGYTTQISIIGLPKVQIVVHSQ